MAKLNNLPTGVLESDYGNESSKLHPMKNGNKNLTPPTMHELMVVTSKALFSKELDLDIKKLVLFVAHKNGLIDEEGERTPEYYALMNDELEKLIRELTGYRKKASGLCTCGCGRDPKGRGRYATAACRKSVSRTSKRIKKEAA